MTDDHLSHHELDTEPFTASELQAIMAYRAEVDGIPDALDMTADELKGRQETIVRALLAESAGALNHWYLTLDTALADLLTCTTESTRYSTAAARFLKAEAAAYHRTRQHFEHITTVVLLGLNTCPIEGNYPKDTNTLNLAMQTLDTTE
ncbi:hypothetical protein ACFWRZ_08790 [Streptomyces rubiginosohelvolus]|uniref:hypothetical protein n=1 Tax=Streptomyces rubiginosohelvolus TaxID=67362 RepID=UPI003648E75F